MVNSGKEKSKRQKEVVYPILQQCCLIQEDDFWKRLFDDLSRGKCPKGITIYNGMISSTQKRNGFSYNINNNPVPEDLSKELIEILKNNAYIYSSTDIENKDGDFQEATNEYISAKTSDNWKKIKTRKMRENPIINYVFKIKKQYKMSNKKARTLYHDIKDALFVYRTHRSEDVIMENGIITSIRDFVYNKDLRVLYNKRYESLDDREINEKVKDVLGSKWEKYVQNVIKSVVKEEP
jgi:hypothetical protein